MPRRRKPGNCMINCAMPPATTPIATPRIGSDIIGDKKNAQPMIQMLKNTGENAGAAKARIEFKMPIASAARLIKIR